MRTRCAGSSAAKASPSRSTSASGPARRARGGRTSARTTCGSMPLTPLSGAASATPKASRDADTRRDVLVIKIGGSVSAEADPALDAVVSLHDGGPPLLVVDGGGPVVGEWSSRVGLPTRLLPGPPETDAPTTAVPLARPPG